MAVGVGGRVHMTREAIIIRVSWVSATVDSTAAATNTRALGGGVDVSKGRSLEALGGVVAAVVVGTSAALVFLQSLYLEAVCPYRLTLFFCIEGPVLVYVGPLTPLQSDDVAASSSRHLTDD